MQCTQSVIILTSGVRQYHHDQRGALFGYIIWGIFTLGQCVVKVNASVITCHQNGERQHWYLPLPVTRYATTPRAFSWQDSRPNQQGTGADADGQAGEKSTENAPGAESIFGAFGKRHYEGGFEEKMTRREAALILGVRESASSQRIKVVMDGIPW